MKDTDLYRQILGITPPWGARVHLDAKGLRIDVTLEHAKHGVRQTRVPWSEPNSRFTLLFEAFAVKVLRETSISGGAKLLKVSRDEAHGIMKRAVERGLAARGELDLRVIGVDEKSPRLQDGDPLPLRRAEARSYGSWVRLRATGNPEEPNTSIHSAMVVFAIPRVRKIVRWTNSVSIVLLKLSATS